MPVDKASILVVDDDVRILRLMQRVLELEGYDVRQASSGEAALRILETDLPDLVILDIMMPGMDGYEVCHRIREFTQIPVIMVTARGDDEDKVKGLDAGADDYVTKPFSSSELTARARAVLRRSRLPDDQAEPEFRNGDLVIDFVGQRVTLGGSEVLLTATEYRLLSYLARNANRVVAAGQILERVWGAAYAGETHILQVNMARVRQKLNEDARNPKYIITRPAIGYMMVCAE